MRLQHLADRNILRSGGRSHPIDDELEQRGLVRMLQLAASTARKMAARRGRTVWAGLQSPVRQQRVAWSSARDMTPIFCDAIAFGSDADYRRSGHDRAAKARCTVSARSPAVKPGPAMRAAS